MSWTSLGRKGTRTTGAGRTRSERSSTWCSSTSASWRKSARLPYRCPRSEPARHVARSRATEAPARGVDEVEGVPRGRRVDDDEVEAALVVELEELLHGHVLLRPRERGGDVAVEAVAQDGLGLGLRRGVLDDEGVERALGVEHQ